MRPRSMVKYLPRQEVRDSGQLGAIPADGRTWVRLRCVELKNVDLPSSVVV